MVSAASGQALGVNFDTLDFGPYLGLAYATGDMFTITISPVSLPGHTLTLTGQFSYNDAAQLNGGFVSKIALTTPTGGFTISQIRQASGAQVDVISLVQDAVSMAPDAFLQKLLAGVSAIEGSDYPDLLRGFGGIDYMFGYGGADTIYGGDGVDVISGGFGQDYLRGDAGDDRLYGGDDFDDINGNTGNDVAYGEGGDDWVVGGKDADLVDGGVGNDIVYGNMGADTCYGGAGNDIVRGGQDDDVVYGGDGDDWISGDKGADTLSGGAGADTFHTFAGAGQDRVTDFNRAEGDRIQLLPGQAYTVSQAGQDAFIDLGNGDGLLLVGVAASSVTPDWFVAV